MLFGCLARARVMYLAWGPKNCAAMVLLGLLKIQLLARLVALLFDAESGAQAIVVVV